MFTGLVVSLGTLRLRSEQLAEIACSSSSASIWADLAIGDSVAVDGVCLTVTEILSHGFVAAISPETVSRTILKWSDGASSVNLEPSLRVGSKLGGHFVTGHIDGVGYLEASVQTANSWEMSFQVPDSRVARYVVSKGSIAVNGVSLTIATCSSTGDWFQVAVIPHTYGETNLHLLQPGSPVNLEADVLGKYVEKFLRLNPSHWENDRAITDFEQTLYTANLPTVREEAGVTAGFLAEHGYL
ncbi:MAG: riboflavin synthase [Elainella sp. Prado103]|nr:riboflavin synthase [Elainella sp. Prado103]